MRVEWNKVIRYLAYTLELLVLFMLQAVSYTHLTLPTTSRV